MKILIYTDGSEEAENALRIGGKLVKDAGAKITLLAVAPGEKEFGAFSYVFTEIPGSMREEAVRAFLEQQKVYLEVGKELLKEMGVRAETRLREGEAVEEISEEAESGKYDLILVGSKEVSELKELLWGSLPTKISQKVKIPIITVGAETKVGMLNFDVSKPEIRRIRNVLVT